MDAELTTRWVEALRSGRYQQGIGRLRTGDKYCCLGVLADLIDSGGWSGADGWYLWVASNGDAFSMLLPPAVLPNVIQDAMSGDNDLRRLSFDQIADKLESGAYGLRCAP